MNFLIAAQSVRNRGARSRKRGRIQNNAVELWNHSFIRTRDCLCLEPVKNVDGFERALVIDSVCLRISRGSGDGVFALIEHVDACGTGTSGMETESAKERETVENVAPFGEFGHFLVIHLLI